jgi:parallel beta-helix repeat protein
MKIANGRAFLILVSLSLVISMFASMGPIGEVQASAPTYTVHSPIHIDGNSDYQVLKSAGGCTGSGTVNDPYVINGFEIISSRGIGTSCIYIGNSTAYLVISNCYLHGANYSIQLRLSSKVTMTNNNCTDVGADYGIYFNQASNNNASNNVCINRAHGIFMLTSTDNKVFNNTCRATAACAIMLKSSSNSNTLSNNICYSSGDNGIYLVFSCNNNLITNNTLRGNVGQGITVASSDNNRMFGNEFIGNHGNDTKWNPQHHQAYDDGINNQWSAATYGNYWSDWTTPDTNGDGVVDSPYAIAGNASKVDSLPLVLTLNITSPSSNTNVSGASVVLSGTASAYVARANWVNEASGLSGQVTGTGSWTASIDLVAGNNNIIVTLTDGHSLTVHDNVTVTANDVLPGVTITSPANGSNHTTGSIGLHWTGSNDGSGIAKTEVSTNGTTWTTVTGNGLDLSLADGSYTVSVRVTTNAGNVNQSSVTFMVDSTKPVVIIDSPDNGSYTASNSVTVQWTASDATSGIAKTEISTDGSAWTTVTGSNDTLTFALGSHTVHVRATDNLGNVNQTSVSFTIDKAAPTIISKSPNGSGISRTATVSVQFSEAMNKTATTIAVNGVTGTMSWSGNNATFTPSSALAYNTVYSVTVSGNDAEGKAFTTMRWTFTTLKDAGIISSSIKDASGNVIANATVTLSNGMTTTTDANGHFEFDNVTSGSYTMTVSKDGYRTFEQNVTAAAGETNELDTMSLTANAANTTSNDYILAIAVGLIGIVVVLLAFVAIKRRKK